MQNQLEQEAVSVRLYNYMCEEVVGSENIVRYRRMYYKLHEEISNDNELELISSGSKAEGLDLPVRILKVSTKMQNQLELETVSVLLYKYLCEKVVGSENIVRYRRLYHKLHDDISSDNCVEIISSGSRAEDLDLPRSHFDAMILWKLWEVYEDRPKDKEDI
ncbi:unnamed protein product [Mytilus coruscus]|uniref:Uncharacterized protein n=1 Tax=Mytilus coruscus TaxID=42192 RepID=A0A6J8BLT1_MYTCO|nr:unnamed protein product [Mytilus coruscus]